MNNSLLDKLSKKLSNTKSNAHRRAPEQEESIRKRLRGLRIRGSGNGKYQKGDVVVKNVLRVECKTTSKKSFSVTREMIEKITTAALTRDEVPAIVIEMLDPETGKPIHEIALVPVSVLEFISKGV